MDRTGGQPLFDLAPRFDSERGLKLLSLGIDSESADEQPGDGARQAASTGSAEAGSDPQTEVRPDEAYVRSPESFPREIFWNLPNTVTMLRIGIVPVLIFVPLAQGPAGSRFMAWAFIIAALTDILDGWLARRDGGRDITRIGKLLDPLADKLLVSTALIMLLAIGRIPLWGAGMVVVIVGRELAVTGPTRNCVDPWPYCCRHVSGEDQSNCTK